MYSNKQVCGWYGASLTFTAAVSVFVSAGILKSHFNNSFPKIVSS
jgi:hypothetical protein